jgi:thiol:disulfide interchange protein DsbA
MMTAKRFLFYGIVYLLSGLLLNVASAETQFQEGTHYQRLNTPVPTSSDNKVEVVEAFWYGCGHCYNLEPAIETWVANKPENVAFTRLPTVLGRSWEPHARAYHTAEVLGVLDKIHQPLLEAIHAEKRRLMNEDQLAEFFAEQGVDKDTFRKTYNSFAVETRLKRSQDLVKRYRLRSVPTIVVNGKYVTDTSMAGSGKKLFEVVNYLVEKEAKG